MTARRLLPFVAAAALLLVLAQPALASRFEVYGSSPATPTSPTWMNAFATPPAAGETIVSITFSKNGVVTLDCDDLDQSVPSCATGDTPFPHDAVDRWVAKASYITAAGGRRSATIGSTTVTLRQFTVGLRLVQQPGGGWSAVATANQNTGVLYRLDVVDLTDGSRPDGGSCGYRQVTCTVRSVSLWHRYQAFVRDGGDDVHPGGVAAASGVVGFGSDGSSNPAVPDTSCSCGDPVDLSSGQLWESATDVAVGGRGPGLRFVRTFDRSRSFGAGALGSRWFGSYDERVEARPDGFVHVLQENGSDVPFRQDGSGFVAADPAFQATLVASPDGYVFQRLHDGTTHRFGTDGLLQAVSDRNGLSTTIQRDDQQRLVSATDASGRQLLFGYTGDRLTSVTGPDGKVTRYGYDTDGELASVTTPTEDVSRFSYATAAHGDVFTDARGHATTTVYGDDALHRVVSQTNGLGRTTTFDWSDWRTGGNVTVTDPAAHKTRFHFAGAELLSKTTGLGTPLAGTWTYSYDASRSRTLVEDPDGHDWTATYDTHGNRLTATDPNGHVRKWTYNALDEPLTYTDPLKVVTTSTYGGAGNVLTRSTPLKGTTDVQRTTYHHDDAGHPSDVTSVTDPRGKTTVLGRDANGDARSSTDPLGRVTTWSRDADGRVLTVVSPRGNLPGADPLAYTTTYTRDDDGRVTAVTDPLGRVARQSFDANGNVATSTSPAGYLTTYTYDNGDQLTKVDRPSGGDLLTTYKPDGSVWTTKDGLAHTTTYAYDALGLASTVTDPLGRVSTVTHDAAGRAISSKDAASRIAKYAYDGAGNLAGINYADAATPDVTYTYDAADQRATMVDGTGTSAWTWDSLGRVRASKNGAKQALAYAYDLDGNLTKLTYPGSKAVVYGYDDAGQLTSATDWATNRTGFGYDPDGNLQTVDSPNAVHEVETWNAAQEPTKIVDTRGTAKVASFAYGFTKANGRLASLTSTGVAGAGTETYGYSRSEQVASVTGGTSPGAFGYDAADELTGLPGVTQTYDAARQLVTSTPTTGAATTFGFDPLGERTSATTGASVVGAAWNQAGVLTKFTSAAGLATTYTFDGDGLRQSKRVGTAPVQPELWSANGGLPMLLSDGTSSFVYGPAGRPIEQVAADGTVTYLHTDALGSVRALTSATGAVTGTATFSAYGTPTRTGATSPLGYAGQCTDAESGYVYMRARTYDPATGQFLSRDPLEAETGDPYDYAGGNPLSNTDPTGLAWGPGAVVGAVAGAVAGAVLAPVLVPVAAVEVAVVVGGIAVGAALGGAAGAALEGCTGTAPVGGSGSTSSEPFDPFSKAVEPYGGMSESRADPVTPWRDAQPWRGNTRTNGQTGRKRRYLYWDYTHGDMEVFDRTGKHLGSADRETGEMTKPPVPGRRMNG